MKKCAFSDLSLLYNFYLKQRNSGQSYQAGEKQNYLYGFHLQVHEKLYDFTSSEHIYIKKLFIDNNICPFTFIIMLKKYIEKKGTLQK